MIRRKKHNVNIRSNDALMHPNSFGRGADGAIIKYFVRIMAR